jgi:protein CpxP
MNQSAIHLRRLLIAAGIALIVASVAQAQPAPDPFEGLFWGPMLAQGPDPRETIPGGHGRGAPPPPLGFASPDDMMPALPMLRGLALTEAQRDQVFDILHAQAPLLREKAKAARRAQEELRSLALSARYDEAEAKTLADAGARAQSELALLRAAGEHRIYMALTDEQRERLASNPRAVRHP